MVVEQVQRMKRGLIKKIAAGVLATACFPGAPVSQAGIRGSAHDFSGQSWSQGEVCIVCHTPHNASAVLAQPLWNHDRTTATFTLYSSDSLHGAPAQPGPASIACLSCHDGTIAMDAFGGNTGSRFVTGPARIGTDLSQHHPIGITVYHPGVPSCQNCHDLHNPSWTPILPFFNGRVECATCHDPHNNAAPGEKLLRKTVTGSAICLHCHAK
jgi:predicted CXXCH cytochrome family protein